MALDFEFGHQLGARSNRNKRRSPPRTRHGSSRLETAALNNAGSSGSRGQASLRSIALGLGLHECLALDLSGGWEVTTSHVEMIACACSDRLRELILDDCVAAVTDAAVARLAALRRLQRLSLRGCTQFSGIGLRMLGSGVRADKAEETGASGYKRRTRGMYAALGAALGAHTPGFANLRALRLDGCVQLTDESMLEIASRCPHLTELGLRGCAGISDRSVCAFGRNGSLLIADFALASAVTDTGACAVGRSCPLTMLSLSASAATDFAARARPVRESISNLSRDCMRRRPIGQSGDYIVAALTHGCMRQARAVEPRRPLPTADGC